MKEFVSKYRILTLKLIIGGINYEWKDWYRKSKKVLESIKDEDLEIKYIGIEKVIYDETKNHIKHFL